MISLLRILILLWLHVCLKALAAVAAICHKTWGGHRGAGHTSPFLLISFFPFSFYRSLPGPPLPLIQHCKLSSGSRQSQAVEHILMHFTLKKPF